MSKLFIRLTVVIVSLYIIACHVAALTIGINLWSYTYTVLFEICVCLCISEQGRYHCKYIKWTAYGITISDALVSTDELFDYLPYSVAVFVPIALIAAGLATTTALAVKHYIKVRKLKKKIANEYNRFNNGKTAQITNPDVHKEATP